MVNKSNFEQYNFCHYRCIPLRDLKRNDPNHRIPKTLGIGLEIKNKQNNYSPPTTLSIQQNYIKIKLSGLTYLKYDCQKHNQLCFLPGAK